MGVTEDLKQSVASMSDEELRAYIREIRFSRRAKKPTESTVTVRKPKGPVIDINKLSNEQAAELLKLLGGAQ